MASGKKYWWLKLKEDFFEDETIVYLRQSSENGDAICLFYLSLCLRALKENGVISRKVGNVKLPHDAKSLSRLTGTSAEVIEEAMELFKQFGLVTVKDNEIAVPGLQDLVGCETKNAEYKRQSRQRQKADNVSNVSAGSQQNVTLEKEIEQDKDKEIEKEIEQDKESSSCFGGFKKPTRHDIMTLCFERQNNINANEFYDYYEKRKWNLNGRTWQECMEVWENNRKPKSADEQLGISKPTNFWGEDEGVKEW